MNLQEYICQVKDLEISLYQQRLWWQELKNKINQLEHPDQYYLTEIPSSKKIDKVKNIFSYVYMCIKIMVTLGGVGVFVFIAFAILNWLLHWEVDDEATIFHIIYIIAGSCIIGSVIITIIVVIINIADSKANINAIRQENQQKTIQNQNIIEVSRRQLAIVYPELEKAEKMYNETFNILKKYYDEGIIFEKYRSIVPICSFYEYLISGRCSKLDGHEGAYNLYETELRMNVIIGKLEIIIEKLDEIQQTQSVMANAIRETNQQLGQMTTSFQTGLQRLDRIETNAALTAYYGKIVATVNTTMLWLESNK